MRRRSAPPPSAQQMIRDYLGRVSVAATKVLPKGDRLLFVGRTRAAIEAQVGPLASADADDVLSALTALGDPEDLAKRERERLYSARRRGAAAAPPALWKPAKAPRRRAVRPPRADGRDPVDLLPTAAAIIKRYAPIAVVINEFYRQLYLEDRTTPYPVAAIHRACAACGFMS